MPNTKLCSRGKRQTSELFSVGRLTKATESVRASNRVDADRKPDGSPSLTDQQKTVHSQFALDFNREPIRPLPRHVRKSPHHRAWRRLHRARARRRDDAHRLRRGNAAPDDALRSLILTRRSLLHAFPYRSRPRNTRTAPDSHAPGAHRTTARVGPDRPA